MEFEPCNADDSNASPVQVDWSFQYLDRCKSRGVILLHHFPYVLKRLELIPAAWLITADVVQGSRSNFKSGDVERATLAREHRHLFRTPRGGFLGWLVNSRSTLGRC